MTKSILWPHQRKALRFIRSRKGKAGLFMEMGTGKTRVGLAAVAACRRVLVVSPVSVCSVWADEIATLQELTNSLPFTVVDVSEGTIRERTERVRQVRKVDKPILFLCNYDSYWREPLRGAFRKAGLDAVIMDEAHRIKGRATKQSHFAHTLSINDNIPIRLALTGTPIANGIEDLYSIYKFIDPTVFGTNWSTPDGTGFEDRYIKMGGYYKHEIVGYDHVDEVTAKVNATAFQTSKSESLPGLPSRLDVPVKFKLTKASRDRYNQFVTNDIIDVIGRYNGKVVEGKALARIVLTKLLRLQQFTSGFVKDDAGREIDVSNEKLNVALDLISDATAGGQRVVVFCRFRNDIKRLYLALTKQRYKVVVITGKVKGAARRRAQDQLVSGQATVLLAQTQTTKEGLNKLTAANVGIFYSVSHSLLDFTQARDRLHRPGQTKPVTYYHLIAKGTVDETVYEALQDKQQIARMVAKLDYARNLLQIV